MAVLLPEFADAEVCDVAGLDVRCGIEVVEVVRLCCDIAKGDQPSDPFLHLADDMCDREAAVRMIVTSGSRHQDPLTPNRAPKLRQFANHSRRVRHALDTMKQYL